MNKLRVGVAGALFALSACQTPTTDPALEEARSAVSAASADPVVTTAAAQELQHARDALVAAESALQSGDIGEARSRAYLARQRALIAGEVAARYAAHRKRHKAVEDPECLRAEARERKAPAAQDKSAQATRQAEQAKSQAEKASGCTESRGFL